MINAALYVMSPLHVIAQITALRTRHATGTVRAHLIMHWPHASEAMLEDLARVIRQMTAGFPEIINRSLVTQAAVDDALAAADPDARCRRFVEGLGTNTEFDEIYFPHDVSGLVYQLLAGANPNALRITTGENLGHVFERDVYFAYFNATPTSRRLLQRVAFWLRPRLPGKAAPPPPQLRDWRPDVAMLLLPVDQSGRYLDGMDLIVPDRTLARDVARECAERCEDLATYIKSLLAAVGKRRCYTLCMQNFAECGTISFDEDVALWTDVIREHCASGGLVLLKSHPAETLPRCDRIRQSLGSDYSVQQFDLRFARYPIELWRDLVLNTTVITASMPLLSLKYLYDVDAIQPFSDTLIERRFPEAVWSFYKNGLSLFTGPLSKFARWNGKSVLWSGEPPVVVPPHRAARWTTAAARLLRLPT